MKKKLMILTMILCLLMMPLSAWASSGEYTTGQVTPRYAYVDGINTLLGISSGTATGVVTVYENTSDPFDYSKLTVYLKKTTGTTVKTWTATKYPNSGGYFTWTGTYDLTSTGTYYIKAVNKLYVDGELSETITTTSVNQTY